MMGTCEYCRGPIGGSRLSFRKYCSVRCENKEQGRQAALEPIRKMVDAQAKDDGLWFDALTAPEAYLQQELRKLHAVVEQQGKA